jgi:pyruvate-ferredoxin/flavodoxin oxidoreductase
MVPLGEFLDLDEDEREGKFPFLWSVNSKQELSRLLVARPMVESCEDRRDFWTQLRAMAGVGKPELSRDDIAEDVRRELVGKLASSLMQLAGTTGDTGGALASLAGSLPASGAEEAPAGAADAMDPWIDTDDCTACDECMNLNPQIFAYNENKKAIIVDPRGGPYRDVVKAAERCTAQVIHPGLPRDRSAKDIDKWIARAEKFN